MEPQGAEATHGTRAGAVVSEEEEEQRQLLSSPLQWQRRQSCMRTRILSRTDWRCVSSGTRQGDARGTRVLVSRPMHATSLQQPTRKKPVKATTKVSTTSRAAVSLWMGAPKGGILSMTSMAGQLRCVISCLFVIFWPESLVSSYRHNRY